MSRLPIPGGDGETWGGILNDFLSQSLNSDGTLKPSSVVAAGAEQASKKGLPNGYPGLGGSGLVPTSELGTGTANTTTYLRGDGSWQVPPGGGGGSSTLAGDSDVSISGQTSGQVLTWNGTTWGNAAPPVISVAGKTGTVTLLASDVGAVAKAGDTMTGKLTVPSFQVTGGSPSSGQVLTADSSGNATWQAASSAPVTSVAGKTGAVTLAATDVSGVEKTVNKDVANGYAGLDSSALLKVNEMPRALGVVVNLGTNNTGTVTCDLSQGIAFKVVLTTNTTISFTNWPSSGLVEPEVYTIQDSTGGHTITVSGVTWEPTGSPPTFNTGANAVNIIPVASFDGGTTVYGITGLQGPAGAAGATGATGATGPAGASSPESTLGWVVPIINGGTPRIVGTSPQGTAFKGYFYRVVIPKTGTLHDVAVYNGATVAGNTNVAVYDTGDASAAHYTPLWSSGSVAASGANAWQVVGDPALSVTAGQQLLLALMNDSTTHTFGVGTAITNAGADQLPNNFIPTTGGASPKPLGTFTFGSLAYSAITETNLAATVLSTYMVIARVA